MINQNNMFIAEVRNVKGDPSKSGKVQIRIYGNHDDEQNIKDDDLPWGTVILPVTSASTQKVGHIPTGLSKGSRVIGFFADDHERQNPYVLGSFYRAAQPGGPDPAGGKEDLKNYGKSPDLPSDGVGSQDAGKTPNNTTLGGTATSTDDAYNKATFVEPGTGPDGISTALSKFAPNGKETTTAGSDPGKDLSDVISEIGTSGEVLKQLISKLNSVLGIMKMTNSSGSGGSSGGSIPPTQSGIPETLVQAMTGALTYYCNKYTFLYVVNLLTNTFANGSFNNLEPINQNIMSESILTLTNNFVKYGPNNLPYTPTPNWNVIPIGTTTFPSPIVGAGLGAPTYYIQQYYSITNDPYPGFIQWEGPTNDLVYTIRDGQPNYPSATAAVLDQAQTEFQNLLSPFFIDNLLTTEDLNKILDSVNTNAQTKGADSALGNGSSADIMGLAMQLLGSIGSMLNLAQNVHLPDSVLNIGSVTQSIQKFTKNASIAKQMLNKASGAFQLPGGLDALSSLGGLTSALGSIGNLSSALGSIGGLTGALGELSGTGNISQITSALSSFGGIGGAVSSLSSLSTALTSISSLGGNILNPSSASSALTSISSLQNALNSGDTNTVSISLQLLNNSLSTINNQISNVSTNLVLTPGIGLDYNSKNTLSILGLSQNSINNINNLYLNNTSLSVSSITIIADISLALEKENIAESEIETIQLLLSEILEN